MSGSSVKGTWVVLVLAAMAAVPAACSKNGDDEAGANASAGADGSGATTGSGAAGTGAGGSWVPIAGAGPVRIVGDPVEVTDDRGSFTCYPTECDGHLLECGNCEDDDEDGLYDWHDPECLGPCDNTEGAGLASDVGGDQGTSCGVDCYFDFGNGPGNDACQWDHRCDPLDPEEPTCPYDESMVGGKKCPDEQDPICARVCLPFTPNGCDCFGCCTFDALATEGPDNGPAYVWIGALDEDNVSTCTLDDVTDPTLCPRCTPVENCLNECGECEVCIGRPEPPPECFDEPPEDGGTPPPPEGQCPEGIQPCGLEGQEPCPPNAFCISGCCQEVVY